MNSSLGVVKNTFSQIAGRAVVVAASILSTALLTRGFGPDGFGDYIFLTSFILLFVGLSDLGTTTIGVREAASHPEKEEVFFGNVLTVRLFLSFLLLAIFNLLVILLPQFTGLRLSAFIGSFVFPFLVLRTTGQAILQTHLRLDLASLLEVVAAMLMLVSLLFLLLFGKTVSLSWLMAFWAVSALISAIIGLVYAGRYLKTKILFDRKIIGEILRQSLPLGAYLLVYAVYDRGIDSFFLKTFTDSRSVGYYGLAYKIHGNLIFGAAFLMNSLFPIISSLKNKREELENIFQKTFTLLLVSGLIVFFGGVLLAPAIIKLIAGNDFLISIGIFRILLFATFFSFLNHLTGFLMIAFASQKKLLVFSFVALILNFVLNFIFIPKYSYWAAAIITVLTEGIIFFLSINFLIKHYNLRYSFLVFRKNIIFLAKTKNNYFENYLK